MCNFALLATPQTLYSCAEQIVFLLIFSGFMMIAPCAKENLLSTTVMKEYRSIYIFAKPHS
jgi:hypothetical protein